MIKKIFIINQFILGFIILGLITSNLYFSTYKQNKYFLKTIENIYDISFVYNTYIISSFNGSGGWLYGGLIPNTQLLDIDKLKKKELEQKLEKNLEYRFPIKSFPDNGFLYIGNFDFDKNIEIFAFELMGTSFIQPVEIKTKGEINNENIITQVKLLFLASFLMMPNFIVYCLFVIFYFLVSIFYGISLLNNRTKTIT